MEEQRYCYRGGTIGGGRLRLTWKGEEETGRLVWGKARVVGNDTEGNKNQTSTRHRTLTV